MKKRFFGMYILIFMLDAITFFILMIPKLCLLPIIHLGAGAKKLAEWLEDTCFIIIDL